MEPKLEKGNLGISLLLVLFEDLCRAHDYREFFMFGVHIIDLEMSDVQLDTHDRLNSISPWFGF